MTQPINNLSAIVATDSRGGIGKNNALAWHLPEDLKWFKEQTLNKPIIMGTNTLQSILSYNKNKLLPERRHILLSKNSTQTNPEIECYASLDALLACVRSHPFKEFMIIGGAQIYVQLLPYINCLYLTRVRGDFKCDKQLSLENYNFSTAILLHREAKKDKTSHIEYEFNIFKKVRLTPHPSTFLG